MKRTNKNKKLSIALGLTFSIEGLCLFSSIFDSILDQYTMVKKQPTESKSLEKVAGINQLNDVYSIKEIPLSQESQDVIEEICNSSITGTNETYNSRYLDIIEINSQTATDAYVNLRDIQVLTHENTFFYDEKNNDIKWDLLAEHIYQNGLAKEQEENQGNTLSLEEIEEKLKNIKYFVSKLRNDFPDYNIKELACKLNNYSFLEKTNLSARAETTDSTITYNNNYEQTSGTDDHEVFHIALHSCNDINNYQNSDISRISSGINIDTATFPEYQNEIVIDPLCAERYHYAFIEEIYAELYSAEVSDEKQNSYEGYDEILTTMQLALGLQDNYKIDSILYDLVYHDPIAFIKHFPVYGKNQEKYFLDNCKMIKSYDILLERPTNYINLLNSELKANYATDGVKELQQMATSQLSKIFFNNLIVMNESYQDEITIEDNYNMIYLFEKYLGKTYQAISTVESTRTGVYLELNQNDSSFNVNRNTFLQYLGKKNHLDEISTISGYFNFVPNDDYQFPSFMGKEKQGYYKQLLQEKNKDIIEPYSMTLKK